MGIFASVGKLQTLPCPRKDGNASGTPEASKHILVVFVFFFIKKLARQRSIVSLRQWQVSGNWVLKQNHF